MIQIFNPDSEQDNSGLFNPGVGPGERVEGDRPNGPGAASRADTRIISPGVDDQKRRRFLSEQVSRISAQVMADDDRIVLPETMVEEVASMSLREWYFLPVYGLRVDRLAKLAAGEISKGTIEKEASCLSVWERHTRPDGWIHSEWPGVSIKAITAKYLKSFLGRLKAAGLSQSYASGVMSHIHGMLRFAVTRGALTEAAKRPPCKSEEGLCTIYEMNGSIDAALNAIASQLRSNRPLFEAFVLANNCGLRPSDTFLLRCNSFSIVEGQPCITVMPTKTKRYGKTLHIPVAKSVFSLLKESRPEIGSAVDSSLIFATLVNAEHATPEKSAAARQRTDEMLAGCQRAGFQFPLKLKTEIQRKGKTAAELAERISKPWQVARATCNERLQRHRPGMGEYILGHSTGSINESNYRKRWSEAVEAVNTLEQPIEFLK